MARGGDVGLANGGTWMVLNKVLYVSLEASGFVELARVNTTTFGRGSVLTNPQHQLSYLLN